MFGFKEFAQLGFHPIACRPTAKPMMSTDIFAQALAETAHVRFGSRSSPLSRSGSSLSQFEDSGQTDDSMFSECFAETMTDDSQDGIILLSDDEGKSSPCTKSPIACDLSAKPPLSSKAKRTCPSDAGEQGPTKKAKPRRFFKERQFTLNRCVMSNSNDVLCVGVKRPKSIVPVPLWSQYTAVWKTAELDDKWIIVSNYERWVMQLVDAVTTKSVRAVAKKFSDLVKKEYFSCLYKARCPIKLASPFADMDEPFDASSTTLKNQVINDPVIQVIIGGHTLTCVNHATRMMLKLDNATVQFITDWVVPLVTKLAFSKDPSPSTGPAVGTLANFHLTACATPNIKDKIQWNPTQHFWEVLVKKCKGEWPDRQDLLVDTKLDLALYEEEKIAAYGRAVHAWNRLDGSKRFRISALGEAPTIIH